MTIGNLLETTADIFLPGYSLFKPLVSAVIDGFKTLKPPKRSLPESYVRDEYLKSKQPGFVKSEVTDLLPYEIMSPEPELRF